MLYQPAYSSNFDLIEEAFAKTKGLLRKAAARTREVLVEAMGESQRKTPIASSSTAATDHRFTWSDMNVRHCRYPVAAIAYFSEMAALDSASTKAVR